MLTGRPIPSRPQIARVGALAGAPAAGRWRVAGGRWALAATLVLMVLGLRLRPSWPSDPRVQTVPQAAPPDAVTLDARSGLAFVASASAATVSLLDLAHGRVLRTVPLGDPATLAPLALALDPATHHLFVADRMDQPTPSVVRMLDSRSGALLATVTVGHEASALAVDSRHDRVLVADETDGTLSLLDARTGTLRRTLPLGLLPLGLAVDAAHNRAFVVGPASPGAVPLSALVTDGLAGLLGVLDTRSGALLSRTVVGSGPSAMAVDPTSGRVFVACAGDDTVRVLDARSGALLRTVTLAAAPSALAVDERRGRVYVASAAGTLSLLDAQTGAPLATRRIDPTADPGFALPYALAVDEARDRVYLSTYGPMELGPRGLTLRGNGTLYVLNARTGAVLRRIAVGVAPQAVAADAHSGRVVVVNSGGEVVHTADGWAAPWIGRLRPWFPWLNRFSTPVPSVTRVPGSVSVIDLGTGTG